VLKSIIEAKTKQNKPEKATVVNLGVSVFHLKVTEKTEKPIDDNIPKIKPIIEFDPELPKAMIIIPTVAINIEIQTFNEIFSLRNKKANSAVKKGMAARQSKVMAAEVFVIEYIKLIIAIPNPVPPIIPE
tara:strand:+ start:105 stop:494 length:390 start_codon:yes stop_codon:yes gene_type:complete